MKKVYLLLAAFLYIGIASAKFVYDPITNTFTYTSDTPPAVVATGVTNTGSVVTGAVLTWTTYTTGSLSGTEISWLLKTLDTHTLQTLSSFKVAYDTEYAKLSTAATDATNKGLMGMVMCFTQNPKSPDQLKIELKNLYDTSTKSLVEKSGLLAGQLTNLETQLKYGTIASANLSLTLVGPKADIATIWDSNKNGSKEFANLLASVTQWFQSAVAKVASGTLAGSTGVLTRYNQFVTLEQNYKSFSDKISLQGISVSNLPQMESAKNAFVGLANVQFASATNKDVLAYVTATLATDADIINLVTKAKRDYEDGLDTYATALLQDLTQTKGVTDVANAVAMVRAIYKPQQDVLCNAFSENLYISELAPKISTQMNDVLSALNTAANRVALEKGVLVKDATQLQQGYLKALATFAESTRISTIKSLKGQVSDAVRAEGKSMLLKARTLPTSIADQVAAMLSKKMQEYAAVGKLAEFNAMITRAMDKLATAKTKTTNKKTLTTLAQIEAAVKLFQ
jgi:hypothetical protein